MSVAYEEYRQMCAELDDLRAHNSALKPRLDELERERPALLECEVIVREIAELDHGEDCEAWACDDETFVAFVDHDACNCYKKRAMNLVSALDIARAADSAPVCADSAGEKT